MKNSPRMAGAAIELCTSVAGTQKALRENRRTGSGRETRKMVVGTITNS
jgi:hypothetical protein